MNPKYTLHTIFILIDNEYIKYFEDFKKCRILAEIRALKKRNIPYKLI